MTDKNNANEIVTVIYKYLKGEQLQDTEELMLAEWLKESGNNRKVFENVQDQQQFAEYLSIISDSEKTNKAFEKFKAVMNNRKQDVSEIELMKDEDDLSIPVVKQKTIRRSMVWLRYAAAIIIIAGIGFYFLSRRGTNPDSQDGEHIIAQSEEILAPSSNKATITLAEGDTIVLDSIKGKTLAIESNVHIQRRPDGTIVYENNGQPVKEMYNLLSVPRGSQIASIVLSDGTKVFLNAASTLKYPVMFLGSERRVEITGEAYFEVAKDPSRKFIVKGPGIITEVLGTHFNVNTYEDEETMSVTLLEGSVKVSGGSSNVVITPGTQAQLEQGKLSIDHSVNIEQVMAWKNGVFDFQNRNLQEVMKQLARWYDIDVVFAKNTPPLVFGGRMGRDLSLTQVMRALKEMGAKFRLEGRTLYVGTE